MNKLIIAVDVDEVVADLLSEWLRIYNILWDDTLRPDKIRGWSLVEQVKPECGKRIYEILHNRTLYDHVKPIPGALEAIRWMRQRGHRVVFVSSCVAGSVDRKVAWLQKHKFLPPGNSVKDFIAATDKSLIGADVLIDDHILNVEAFPRYGILLHVPHNSESYCSKPRASTLMDAAMFADDMTDQLVALRDRRRD